MFLRTGQLRRDVGPQQIRPGDIRAEGIAVTVEPMNFSGTPQCVKNQPLAWRAVKLSEPA